MCKSFFVSVILQFDLYASFIYTLIFENDIQNPQFFFVIMYKIPKFSSRLCVKSTFFSIKMYQPNKVDMYQPNNVVAFPEID